jgi:hypothetical protein
VQWFFDIDDTEEFEQSNGMRLRRAAAWAQSQGAVFDLDAAQEALVFRHHSRDGRLGHWTPELVREFLTEIAPERFTGGLEHYAHLPEALRTWLRFMDFTGALDPTGSGLAELEAAVDECAERFPETFTDPANWGPSRIAAEAALASGIDLSTPDGIERFNAFMADEEPVYDREMMAAAVARQAARQIRSPRLPALPAVELPTADQVSALAAATEAARGVAALLDWLGEGRALTQRGNLRKADAAALVDLLGTGDDTDSFTSAADLPVLNWYTELVVGTGLARRVKQRLVPVAKRSRIARDPVALLRAAWGTASLWRTPRPGLFARADEDEAVMRTLIEALLGTASGADLPVGAIRERIARAVYGDGADPDDLRGLVAALTLDLRIDHVLTVMHRLGTVEFDGPWSRDEFGVNEPGEDIAVRLTELGHALMWAKWREDGLVAPVVGELTACSAAAMLMSVVEFYGQDTGVEEIRRWLAANGDDPAPLLEAISANPFRTSRSAMLGALADAVGPHLLDLAEDDPRLAPTALMLGGLRGRIDLSELMEGTEGEQRQAVLGMAEQILEMLEHLGPEGLAASFDDLPADAREGMAAMIAESGHPDRWLVDLFAEEVAPILLGPGTRRRTSLAEARSRSKHVKRRRKPKRRRR